MKKGYWLLVLFVFVQCKKEINPTLTIEKKIVPKVTLDRQSLLLDSNTVSTYKSKGLMDFYRGSAFHTFWVAKENREKILSEIGNCSDQGLNPEDYNYSKLTALEKNWTTLTPTQIKSYDILISYNFRIYLAHLATGKMNPKFLYGNWDLKPKDIAINTLLFESLNEKDITSALTKCKPKQQVYVSLLNALKILATFPNNTFTTIPFSEKIKPSDTASTLISIKKRLIYWKDLKSTDSLTEFYDKATVKALKKFQFRHGLIPDGVIGKSTINALNFSKEARRQQIIANIERWRWFPNEFGSLYTLVNIPNFSLVVVKNQDTIESHKVVVGTDKRKSPILSSKLSSVVFNPTWTVPPTILKEDVIPESIKNSNYLASKNIKVYDSNNKEVAIKNWKASKANSYRYVQDPGAGNSLGQMKILFPNHFSVYLHDTNHKDGFSRHYRSLSSGCTRIDNPLLLAKTVLDDSINWNSEKIDAVIQAGKTKAIKIKANILHYQLYWTAWSKKDQLYFREDIYNLDQELYNRLRN